MNRLYKEGMLVKSKFLFKVLFVLLFGYFSASAQTTNCTNSNFENGDFSNWQGGTGTPNGNSGNNPGGCCPIILNQFMNSGGLTPPRFTITTPITDPNTLNNLVEVSPLGGNFSARLGAWQNSFYAQNNPGPFPGSKSEMVKYTFTVTPASELFVYSYAVVLEDPKWNVTPHSQNEKPRFEIKVLDAGGNYVPNALCGHYMVVADSNVAGFLPGITTSASVVHYRDWTTVGIDLTAYLNQSITIEFQVGDCALGGHFGYAYIDAYCGPLQVLTQYCVGQNQVTLTAPPGFGYLWMPGGATTQTITVNNPVVGSVYTCALTSVTGCVANISTIVEPTLVTPDFGYQVNCDLNTVLFLDSTVILNGVATNYSWNFGDGSPILSGAQNNPVHTFPGPGTYTVTLDVSTVAGCSGTIAHTVVIPDIIVDAPASTICSASFVTIHASGGTTYTWSPSTGLNATTGATVQASPSLNTTYTVTAFNANGCSGTATAVVNIAPNLVITVTAVDDSICYGHSSIIHAIGGTNYTWSPSTYLNTSTGSNVTSLPLANITYTVFATDANGCSGQASIPIISVPNPVIAVSSMAVCSGQPATLTAFGVPVYQWSNGATGSSLTVSPTANTAYTVIGFFGSCTDTAVGNVIVSPLPIVNASSSGNICLTQNAILTASGASTYSWSPSTGLNTTTGTSVTSSPVGNTTYTVLGTDVNGCTAISNVQVDVYTPPIISATPAFTVLCIGSNANLVASGALNYFWSPSAGLSSSTGSSILANPTSSTTYTVIGIDANGCADTFSLDLFVSPGPSISIASSNSTICFGDNAVLNASGASTYSWSPTTNLNSSTGASVIASPTITTSYLVTAMDSFGCVANSYSTVTVLPLPVINCSSSGNLCVSGTVQLTATGGVTYKWSPSTGLSATTGSVVNATLSSTTTYTVVGFAANGCSSSSNVVVNVNPNPIISASPTSAILCTSSSATLSGSGALNYFWSPSINLSASTGSNVIATPSVSTTYTLIGIDGNGCADTTSLNLIVSPGPALSISSSNPSICVGQTTTLVVAGAITYTWSPSASLNTSTGATVIANPLTTTTYTVNAIDATGCVANVNSVVVVNPLPVVTIVQQTPQLCIGEATALTASGASSYLWSPTVGLSDSTGSIVTANPTFTSTYSVTGTSSYGCTSNNQIIVTIFPSPVLSLVSNVPEFCAGGTAILTASGALSYFWSPANNLSSSTGASVTAIPTASTIFTIIGTDANGCTATANTNLIVNQPPIVHAYSSSPTVCLNSAATLTATGAATYTWNPTSTLSSSTGSSVFATPLSVTTYAVVGVDTNGCVDNAYVVVLVDSLPTITSSDTAMCLGFSASLTVTGASTYAWSPSTNLNTTNGATVIATPTATITYNILGTDLNGCTGATTSTVIIHPLPIIGVTAVDSTFCNGQSTTITATGATNYLWSPSTGLSATSGNTVMANPITSTTYSITGTDLNGCQAQNIIPITVNQLPTVISSTASPSVCLNSSTTLTTSGASTYIWSPSTGLSSSTGNSVTTTPLTSITYTVTGTDVNGCTATSTVNVNVNSLPTVTSLDTAMCLGFSASLTVTGASTYAWSPSTNLNTTNGATVIATPTATITYNILGTDLNGCTGATTSTVIIHPLPIIGVTAVDSTFCNGQSTTITATGATNYLWSPSTGLSATSGNTVMANPITSTTYSITGTDLNGCQAQNIIPITVNQLPTVISSTASPSVCLNSSTTLTTSGASTYIWSPSTGLSSSTGNSVTTTPLTSITYTVTGTDVNGCTATSTVNVNVNSLPTVTSLDTAMCLGFSASLTVTGASTYAWSPSTNLNTTNGATVIATPTATITYNILGTDLNGCTGATTSTVIIHPLPIIGVTAVDSTFCNGQSTTITATGATNYLWSPSTGLSATSGNTVMANPITSTTYSITGTDLNGCQAQNIIPITVNQLPTVISSTASPSVCLNSSTTLTTSGASTYIWSPSTGLSSSTGNSVTTTPLTSITYTVTGTDVNGCTATSTVNVNVNSLPTVTSLDTAMCLGFSASLTVTGASTYAWSPSTNLNTTNGATVIATPTATITYNILGTDLNGCTGATTSTVIIHPLPIIGVTAVDSTFCNGQSTTITATGATNYLWSPSTGLSATSGNTVMANPITSTTYSITGTDLNGCQAQNIIPITVNQLPTVISSTASPSVCLNSSTTLTTSGASTYIWSPSTGLSSSTGNSVTTTPLTSITYTVTGTDVNGCTATSTVNVNVNSLPTVTSLDTAMCLGFSASLTVTGASTYAWSPSTNLNTTNGATVIATPTATITYNILGTDLNGCTGATTSTVIIHPLPIIGVTAVDSTFCNGQSTTITATGATNYLWSPSTGLSATSGNTVMANPITSTTYSITGTDLNGCQAQNIIPITVNQLPTVISSTASPSVCLNSSTTLTTSGASTYIWSPSTGLSSSTGNSVTTTPLTSITYTVTGTDVNGCTATSTVNVNVNSLPTVTSLDTAMCLGFSASLTVTGASTYAWSPSTNLNTTNGATVIATPTATITYNILGTDLNGCTGATTSTVIIHPLPIIGVTAVDSTFCNGQSTTITATGATNYLWSPSTGLSATSGNTVMANPITSTTYSITGTDLNGCQAQNIIPITVNQLPTVISSTASPSVCLNSSTTLTTSGASTYIWSPSTGLSSSTGNSVTTTPLTSITYTVTGTDVNGCTATSTVNVNVNSLPTVTSLDTAMCLGFSASLTVTGASTYAWSPSTNLNTTNGATVIATPTATITYNILGTDLNGCTGATTSTVIIHPLPIIGVTAVDSTFCNGQSTTITATGATNYLWSPSTGLSATSGNTVMANPITSTTYSITGTDLNGCQAQNIIPVTIYSLPVISISPNTPSICPGDFATLVVTGAVNYLWSTNALGNAISVNPIVNTAYSVIGTDANGCTATVTTLVTINPVPVIYATALQPTICDGLSTTITASGAIDYTWSPSTGLSATTGSIVTASPLSPMTYTIVGTNATGCKDTTTVTIDINPLPVAVAGTDENICLGSAAQLNASGGTTYQWSPASVLNNPAIANPIASPSVTTSFIVVVGNQFGCFKNDTMNVIVHALPVVDAGSSKVVCYPNATNLSGTGAIYYYWTPADYLNDTSLQSPVCVPLNSITYTLFGYDSMGCSASDTVSVKLMKPFQVVASPDAMICVNDFIQLNASGGYSYSWTPVDGLDNASIPNPTAAPIVTTTYIVYSTDGVCFNSADTVVINVNQLPIIYAGADAEIIYGQTYQLNAYSNGGTILWEPPTFLDCNTCQFPVASHVNIPITYKLTVTDSLGCKAEDYVKINLACSDDVLYVPDAFTPNADGKNDVFKIRTYGLSQVTAFRVFNRWGEMVFETYDVNDGWDGTWQGKLCTPAVYVWYIQGTCANGFELKKKGNVTLIR